MKKFLITLLLCLLTLPALAENTILIIGDSISAGLGIDPKQGWPVLLQKRLQHYKYNYRVINASISGDTTSNGLDRLSNALERYHPHITIIELGGNDGLRGLQITEIKSNLQRMIHLTQQAKSKVLVLGVRLPPNYGITYTQQFQDIFARLSNQPSIRVIPLFLKGIDNNQALMQIDGIHPTSDAQEMILNNVWPDIKILLK